MTSSGWTPHSAWISPTVLSSMFFRTGTCLPLRSLRVLIPFSVSMPSQLMHVGARIFQAHGWLGRSRRIPYLFPSHACQATANERQASN